MSHPHARFDAAEATQRLQDAVRTHQVDRLDELVSDRFMFSSSRSILRLGESGYREAPGKRDWIEAALSVEWREFALDVIRFLDLGDVVVVDFRLRQVARLHDSWAQSAWVVTDVWVVEGRRWRLAARHAELAGDG